jgi:hypothetical protein
VGCADDLFPSGTAAAVAQSNLGRSNFSTKIDKREKNDIIRDGALRHILKLE